MPSASCGSRRTLAVVAVLVAVVAAACGGTETVVETRTITVAPQPEHDLAPPRERVLFGHIRSLRARGDAFELRLDPAWFLSGETANVAAAEDGVVEPGEPVPNDNYVVDEGRRLLTYTVPDEARVTVLTNRSGQIESTPISVAELARVLAGTSRIRLFEPLDSGVWVTTDNDSVRAIDQQYRP